MNQTPELVPAAIILATGLVVMLLGLRLALRSWGGHPLPAGFELSGATSTDPSNQPLRTPRRAGRLLLGLWMMLVGLGVGGGIAAMSVLRINPANYEPAWVHLFFLHHGSSADRAVAMRQLTGRSFDNRLTAAQVHQLALEALAIQADPLRPWNNWWGGWIEMDHRAGGLSAADWEQYLQQITLQTDVHLFDLTRGSGESATLDLSIDPQLQRSANGWPRGAHYDISNTQLTLDDRPIESTVIYDTYNTIDTVRQPRIQSDLGPLMADLADGKHTVRVRVHLTAVLPERTIEADVDQTKPLTITSHGYTLIHAPQATDAIRRALHVSAFKKVSTGPGPTQVLLQIRVDGDALPVNIGFIVQGVSSGDHWSGGEFGTLHCDAKGPAMTWVSPQTPPLLNRSTIDVSLRPMVRDAQNSAHVVWDGSLVYYDIPIISEPPAHMP